eukprot:SAG11_NODE_34_length_22265_cov_11.264730_3_plen_162_part_00
MYSDVFIPGAEAAPAFEWSKKKPHTGFPTTNADKVRSKSELFQTHRQRRTLKKRSERVSAGESLTRTFRQLGSQPVEVEERAEPPRRPAGQDYTFCIAQAVVGYEGVDRGVEICDATKVKLFASLERPRVLGWPAAVVARGASHCSRLAPVAAERGAVTVE